MAESTLWWLAAGALIAVELVTGTFYMLMIAMGLVAAALGAHAGLAVTWQWVIAALVGGGSIVVWRRVRGSQPQIAPARANRDVNLDIGETVHVGAFNDDGTCSVQYRGARWDAVLAANESAESGSYTIVEVVGSRLILKKTPS